MSAPPADASTTIYALDFDGVVVDSVDESSASAFKAARAFWGDGVLPSATSPPTWLADAMRTVRPVVETGYENVLLVRYLAEAHEGGEAGDDALADAVSGVLRGWRDEVRGGLMERWGVAEPELIEAFGHVRDAWMSEDLDGWIGANRLYVCGQGRRNGGECAAVPRSCVGRGVASGVGGSPACTCDTLAVLLCLGSGLSCD